MSDSGLRGVSDVLCAAGIGIAGYLTYVHYARLQPVAASRTVARPSRPRLCDAVQIPVAVLGLLSFVVIFISLRLRGEGPLLTVYALTLIAFAFSVYLTYRDLFTIHSICSSCVPSAAVFTLLGIVGSRRALHFNYAGAFFAPPEPGRHARPTS